MGNSSGKEGGDLSGHVDGFGSYSETRTAPGAPGAFQDASFATPLGAIGDEQHYKMDHHGADGVGSGDMDVEGKEDEDEDHVVPTVFRWEHGGRQVYITGTFNNWEKQIPMHRSGNDFTYIHDLKKGKHAFKFIVDDEWRFAPDQPTVADIEGRVNNFIDVSDFTAYTGEDDFEQNR
jgi:Glycogen recognition site of AMP-activated protein kinase